MTKIKTFEFMVSKHYGNEQYKRCGSMNASQSGEMITSPEQIDTIINDFIEKNVNTLNDIKIDHYTVERNNNGYCDIIIAKYTVIYK